MTNSPDFDTWRKSSHSGGGDNCVEVAFVGHDQVGVRDSKNPDAGHLTFTTQEWAAFLDGVQAGEFS